MLKDRKPGVVFFPHFIPEVGIPLCQTLWLKWIHLFSFSKQKKKRFRLHCGSVAKMVESVNVEDMNCLMTSWFLVT